ncbi:hypothetical protein KJ786_01625 [Patescibacteria group bacterium]|nr:hypothetical protein [Patescibacteria group bacterium]
MAVLIASIILFLSLIGIGIILWKKIPVLIQMPEVHEGVQRENIVGLFKKKVKSISFDKLIFLKTLSKTRVFILKIEKFIDNHLQKTRKKIVKKQEEVKKEENNSPTTPPITPV